MIYEEFATLLGSRQNGTEFHLGQPGSCNHHLNFNNSNLEHSIFEILRIARPPGAFPPHNTIRHKGVLTYQLNTKMSLKPFIISSFTSSNAIFEKNASHVLSTSHAVFMKLITGKPRQASSQIVWLIGMPKRIPFPQLQNYYPLALY